MNETSTQLGLQAGSALKWTYGGALVKGVCQLGVGVLLARILGPQPYGLVAVCWLVIGAGNLIADFGFGSALVQRRSLRPSDTTAVFSAQLGIGVLLTAVVWASAGLVAAYFGRPELRAVMRALSLLFLVQAVGQTANGLLRRELKFRRIQICQVTSYLCSYPLLGVPLALGGWGVWSLVVAQLGQSLLYSVLTYGAVRHPLALRLPRLEKGILSFGASVAATNLVNYCIATLDSLFIGRAYGVVSLGLYNRAYYLMATPVYTAIPLFQTVLFPAYSRAHAANLPMQRGYVASLEAAGLAILPLCCGIAAVPATVLETFYGTAWLAAAPLLVPLALAMPLHGLMSMAGPLVWGSGRVQRELVMSSISLAVFVLLLVAVRQAAPAGVAWAVLAVYFVRLVLMTSLALQTVSLGAGALVRALRGPVTLGAVVFVLAAASDRCLAAQGWSAAARLAVALPGALSTALALLWLRSGYFLSTDLRWAAGKCSPSLERWMRARMPVPDGRQGAPLQPTAAPVALERDGE